VTRSLLDRQEHRQWEREEASETDPEQRTGKIHFRNCDTGCPFQLAFEASCEVVPGGDPLIRDSGCEVCILAPGPVAEVIVVDQMYHSPTQTWWPHWLVVGVGMQRMLNRSATLG
jgi:hypothetical protein